MLCLLLQLRTRHFGHEHHCAAAQVLILLLSRVACSCTLSSNSSVATCSGLDEQYTTGIGIRQLSLQQEWPRRPLLVCSLAWQSWEKAEELRQLACQTTPGLRCQRGTGMSTSCVVLLLLNNLMSRGLVKTSTAAACCPTCICSETSWCSAGLW